MQLFYFSQILHSKLIFLTPFFPFHHNVLFSTSVTKWSQMWSRSDFEMDSDGDRLSLYFWSTWSIVDLLVYVPSLTTYFEFMLQLCIYTPHPTRTVLFPSWTQFLYFTSHFVLHCKQQKIPVIGSSVSISAFDGWLRSKGSCGLACIEDVGLFRDICSDSSLKPRWKLRLPVSS